jgi:uncharacterized protein YjbI with pentapeptide repeats
MTKTITVSDETYELIKSQVEKEESNKLQIKTLAGEVLFESDKTTLKEAVEEAVSRGAYLRGADLEGADLRDADLEGAYLRGADLGDADLRDAYLGDANLEGANLIGTNLRGANLEGANLKGADFYHAKFYGRNGNTKIKKNQIDDFLTALGVVVEG